MRPQNVVLSHEMDSRQNELARQRGLRDNKRKCLMCARTFSKAEHLERHIRSHTKEKPFECQQCHRKYGRKYVKGPQSRLLLTVLVIHCSDTSRISTTDHGMMRPKLLSPRQPCRVLDQG